jgi:hypothetical protein
MPVRSATLRCMKFLQNSLMYSEPASDKIEVTENGDRPKWTRETPHIFTA